MGRHSRPQNTDNSDEPSNKAPRFCLRSRTVLEAKTMPIKKDPPSQNKPIPTREAESYGDCVVHVFWRLTLAVNGPQRRTQV